MQISNTATGKESETPFRSNAYQTAHTTTPHEFCNFNEEANLLLQLNHCPTPTPAPAPDMKKAGRRGRKPTLIWDLHKILQNDEFPDANWVNCFSEQGGQNFIILNNEKENVATLVGSKSFSSLRRNLRNYGISANEPPPNSENAVLMFECNCPFKSKSNTNDIQQVIAIQTENRKRKHEKTNTTLSYKTYTGGLNGSQSESVTELSASRFKVPKVPE